MNGYKLKKKLKKKKGKKRKWATFIPIVFLLKLESITPDVFRCYLWDLKIFVVFVSVTLPSSCLSCARQ